jgi:hypothetical protein
MMNPFLHSEMDFKQQNIVILCKFISSDSNEKNHFVEQLDNALNAHASCIKVLIAILKMLDGLVLLSQLLMSRLIIMLQFLIFFKKIEIIIPKWNSLLTKLGNSVTKN